MFQKTTSAVCLLAILIIAGSGCQQQAASTDQSKIVQFASTKPSYFGLPAEFTALHADLERTLDSAIQFRSQPDGAAIGQQLVQGDVQFAILTASEYAEIPNPEKLTLVASGVNSLGKTTRKAFVVVKAKSHVKTIADCQGKRFAFGSHGDLLTDVAAQAALENAGVPVKKLLLEILPPPVAFEGRLYLKDEVAKTIANDLTVNAGVIDEINYAKLPDTDGNFIVGPSKDQFEIVGETMPIPEVLIVAGPSANASQVQRVKDYLLNDAGKNDTVCKQLGISGFAQPDRTAYDAARGLTQEKK